MNLTKDMIDGLMLATRSSPAPDLMAIGRPQHAMMRAALDFAGRDRRRIKREMNKAWWKARRQDIASGAGRQKPEPRFTFWRSSAKPAARGSSPHQEG